MRAKPQDAAVSAGLLVLRLGAGGFMLTHGWGKVKMAAAGEWDKFGDPIGLGNAVSLVLAAAAEFGCSLLVVVGLTTRLAAAPLVFTMLVAAFIVHARDPWSMEQAAKAFFAGQSQSWASKEPAILYLVPFLALMFTGGGRFSLDALIAPRLRRRRATGRS